MKKILILTTALSLFFGGIKADVFANDITLDPDVHEIVSIETRNATVDTEGGFNIADTFISMLIKDKNTQEEFVSTTFSDFNELQGTFNMKPNDGEIGRYKIMYMSKGSQIAFAYIFDIAVGTTSVITTKPVSIQPGEHYEIKDSFDNVKSTFNGNVAEINTFEDFIYRGGRYSTTVDDTSQEGEFETTFSYYDAIETVKVKIETKLDPAVFEIASVQAQDFFAKDDGRFDPKDGFISMQYKNKTTGETYESDNYKHFLELGGNVEFDYMAFVNGSNEVETKYIYHDGTQPQIVFATVTMFLIPNGVTVEILTNSVELNPGESYLPEASFDKMIWTKDGVETVYDTLQKFIDFGGKYETNLEDTTVEGVYDVTFRYVSARKQDTITVKNGATVDFDLSDVSLNSNQEFNVDQSFNEVTVNKEGVINTYSTIEEFEAAGGTIDTTEVPLVLQAGSFDITYTIENRSETVTLNVTHYDIKTKEVTIYESDTYEKKDSFDELIITNPDLTFSTHSFDEFETLNGTSTTTVIQPHSASTYTTTFSIEGYDEEVNVIINPDTVEVEFDLKVVKQNSNNAFSLDNALNKVVVTSNGVPKTYNTVEEFLNAGGVIDSSEVPNDLSAGTYNISFTIEGETESTQLLVTHYEIKTKEVTIYESDSYDKKDSFDELIITTPDNTTNKYTYTQFVAMDGTSSTTVLPNHAPDTYHTTFTIKGYSETSDVIIKENTLDVVFDTNEVNVNTNKTYNVEDSFNSVTVTQNGVATTYTTHEDFERAGGTVDVTQVPTALVAGTYDVTFEILGKTHTDKVLVTHYEIKTKEVTIFESDSYSKEDSFDKLLVTRPNSIVEEYTFEEFETMNGTSSTTVTTPHGAGAYTTTFSIEDYESQNNVVIKSNTLDVVFDTNEVNVNTNKTYNVEDSFNTVTVTQNGVATTYSTLEDFERAGGTVDVTQVPTALAAGTYDVTFEILGESKTDKVLVTHYEIKTKEVTIFESDDYNKEDSFDKLLVTRPNSIVEEYTFEEFETMNGTSSTTVTIPHNTGAYTTTFSIEDYESQNNVVIKSNTLDVVFDTNEVNVNTNKTYNVEDSFNSVTVTQNGVSTTYSTLEDFEFAGGTVDVTQVPTTLVAGTYDVTFEILGESKTDKVLVTHYEIKTKEVTIFESDDYNKEDSFDKLLVTRPNNIVEEYTFEEFETMNGTSSTTVTTPYNAGAYTTTFELEDYESQSDVVIKSNTLDVVFDTNEVNVNTNKTYNVEDSFNSVTVTQNGVATTYSTLEDFELAGGTVDVTQVPTTLVAGTYDVTFKILGESKTDKVLVTHYEMKTKDIKIFENDSFDESDGFESLVITLPNLTQETYGFEKFIELGGTVTTTVKNRLAIGSFTTTYAIYDYSSNITVEIVKTPQYQVTAILGYDGLSQMQEITLGDTLQSDFFTPEREGYVFVGWYADRELTTLYDFDTPVDSDFEIFAKWQKEDKDEVEEEIIDPTKPHVEEDKEKDEVKNNDSKNPQTGINNWSYVFVLLIIANSVLFLKLKRRKH